MPDNDKNTGAIQRHDWKSAVRRPIFRRMKPDVEEILEDKGEAAPFGRSIGRMFRDLVAAGAFEMAVPYRHGVLF